MEEKRYNCETVLTDAVDDIEFAEALLDARNKSVALHKPGSTIRHSDGTEYVVQGDGSWVRVKLAPAAPPGSPPNNASGPHTVGSP